MLVRFHSLLSIPDHGLPAFNDGQIFIKVATWIPCDLGMQVSFPRPILPPYSTDRGQGYILVKVTTPFLLV
jgi:hypothetical protein